MNKLNSLILVTLFASLTFAYNLTSVSDISTGKSNIAFIINHEALLINPALLYQTKFAVSNQQIDTTGIKTKSHILNYIVFNGFGVGEMHRQELVSTKNINVGLLGYGSKINKNFSWGLTYETITIKENNLSNSTWSTLLGMNYSDPKNNIYVGLTLEHFFKDTNVPLDADLPPTIALGFNLIPWNQVMWSNKLSYIRQANQKVKYNSGVSVMVSDNIMLNVGANESGYALGFDLPLVFDQKGLGALRYAVEVPYVVSEPIVYSFAYTWGK